MEDRFWKFVYKTWNCWFWIGALNEGGYGVFQINDDTIAAHRMSWQISIGPIPQGKFVLHTCDTPPCVRPDHLFIGTSRENMLDAFAKGRKFSPDNRGERSGRAILTEEKVREMRKLYAEGVSDLKLAQMFGIGNATAYSITRRINWKHI